MIINRRIVQQPDVSILCKPDDPAVEGIPSEITVEDKPLAADMAANLVAGWGIFSETNSDVSTQVESYNNFIIKLNRRLAWLKISGCLGTKLIFLENKKNNISSRLGENLSRLTAYGRIFKNCKFRFYAL